MPRKIDPRWGEIVPGNPLDFVLKGGELSGMAGLLGLSRDEDIKSFKAELEQICQFYFARRAQDEDGPLRAGSNAALKQLAAAGADDFIRMLCALNYRAESTLMDALYLYSDRSWLEEPGVDGAFSFLNAVKSGRDDIDFDRALDIIRAAIEEYLPSLHAKGGPDNANSLSLAADELLDLYHRVTGKIPTHSVIHSPDHSQGLNSEAGKFIQMVFDLINEVLVQAESPGQGDQGKAVISKKILPTRIFTEVRRAVRRFKSN